MAEQQAEKKEQLWAESLDAEMPKSQETETQRHARLTSSTPNPARPSPARPRLWLPAFQLEEEESSSPGNLQPPEPAYLGLVRARSASWSTLPTSFVACFPLCKMGITMVPP